MGFFDSFDDDELSPKKHWLDDWLVQLPVNKRGQLRGDADQAWPPSKSKAPWYRIQGRELSFEKPKDGARTGNTSSTRTELNQTKKWSNGKIAFTVDVRKTGPEGAVVLQCRHGGRSHELVQLRFFDNGTFNISMNEGNKDDKWKAEPVDVDKPIRVECKVTRNKTIVLKVNGRKFEAGMKHSYEPKGFNWKIGLYGSDYVAQSKVTGFSWA